MNLIKPFGDHADDGVVQVSFTLPVRMSSSGRSAAQLIGQKMGLVNPEVVHEIDLNGKSSYR